MAENDRLKREIRAEIAKREELQRNLQTQKPQLDILKAENSRLANIKAIDDNIVARRDRKIQELKAELEVERQKRESYENRAQEAEQQRDEHMDASKKELQTASEEAKHASAHASILQTSHAQLSKEYRQRIATTTKDLRDLAEAREEDRRRLAKLDVVTDQMRLESERMRKVNAELLTVWRRFENETTTQVEELEDDARRLKENAAERDRSNRELYEQMQDVMGQMKWVMRIDQLQNDGLMASPPPSPNA